MTIAYLNKTLADLTVEEVRKIHQRWTGIAPYTLNGAGINLTPEEQAWLSAGHTVRVRVSYWPPFMFNEPKPSGIAVDYLKTVAEQTGFKVQFIPHHGFYNLKVAGSTPFGSHTQAMGIRKDWPELAFIISKGLKAIPAEQRIAIGQKWGASDIGTVTKAIPLSPEERSWLSRHPVIKIGIAESWAPFVYIKKDGSLKGYDVDFMARINTLTGADIQLVAGRWKDMVERAKRREIDGLAESAVVESRREHFQFTDPYNIVEYAAVTLPEKSAGIRHGSDLRGKRIACLKGNAWTEQITGPV